jgi:hypothetical protein
MADVYCFSFVEDEPSAEVLRKLVEAQNASAGPPHIFFRDGYPRVVRGYGQIKKRAPNLLQMAKSATPDHTLVLTDLDREECAPTLIRKWFGIAASQPIDLPCKLSFRVAVREVEAWLMADRDVFAKFLQIPPANFPKSPDDLRDPKQELLGIIHRKGRKRWQRDMLPSATAHVGPRYNERICQFIADRWKPERAASSSPSLHRAIDALSLL